MKNKMMRELVKLKNLILDTTKNKDKIIEDYGSIDNYYKLHLKNVINDHFPLINKYLLVKEQYASKHDGQLDKFYIDLFKYSRKKIIEEYGNLATGAIKYSMKINKEFIENKNVNKVNYIVKQLYDNGIDFDELIQNIKIYQRFLEESKKIDYDKIEYNKHKINTEDIIMYAKKVIESIDHDLLEDFDSFIKNGSLKVYNKYNPMMRNEEYKNFCKRIDNDNYLEHEIYIRDEHDYNEIITIVHEFMHSTNQRNKKLFSLSDELLNHEKYSEFISIYFEKYAVDFLNKNYNIPIDYFDNIFRNRSNVSNSIENLQLHIPFLIFKNYGEINFENYKKTLVENNINIPIDEELFGLNMKMFLLYYEKAFYDDLKDLENKKKEHPNLLGLDEEVESLRKIFKLFDKCTPYLTGTLLAFRIKDEIKPKELLKFSLLLNEDYDNNKDNPLFKKIENYYNELSTDDTAYKKMIDELNRIAFECQSNKRGSL